jgi:integrase/recombinase XerD
MHLLQSGVDISVIALWLGHESTETTPIYVEGISQQRNALSKSSLLLPQSFTASAWMIP